MNFGVWDPGSRDNVGFCFWSEHGYEWSMQGNTMQVFQEVYRELRGVPDIRWTMEALFVGRSPRGSLTLAESRGEARGLMRAAKMLSDGWWWEPMAGVWRKMIGFPGSVPNNEKPGKMRRTKAKDYEEMACLKASEITGSGFLKKQEHEADAICMAYASSIRWQSLLNGPKQPSLFEKSTKRKRK